MTGDTLYIAGTLLQVWAYTRSGVSMNVACVAGAVYWIALLAAWHLGKLR